MPPDSPRAKPTNVQDARGTLEYIGRTPTEATLRVVVFPRAVRPMRALRALGVCWGLAVLAVFLPLLHFVLVPGLLIAGIVLGLRTLGERATILSMRGSCPACAEPFELALKEGASEKLELRCPACGRALQLLPDHALLGD